MSTQSAIARGASGRVGSVNTRQRRDPGPGSRVSSLQLAPAPVAAARGGKAGKARKAATRPSAAEIVAITGATYASAYRWITGRSRFPLEQFLKVVLVRGADLKTATSWAETWLGVSLTDLPRAKP